VYAALDLCLECRACKSECPVGVDVARMKSEFLAAYWHTHGTPRRARALGRVDRLAAWGSRLAPLANVVGGSALARRVTERMLGVDRRRTPPRFARRTWRQSARVDGDRSPADVLVFVDTFTNHFHPQIGAAALDVLARLGYRAALAPNVCCGRPAISQGLLDEARARARENATRLLAAANEGRTLLFLEPSCLSAVREDAPDLLSGRDRDQARVVAARARLFEEWLEAEAAAGRAALQFRSRSGRVVLHGHCHQKAMADLAPAKRLFARIPGAAVVDLDAGCCGMAGSFGYMKGHYEVSKAIGERRLLPAARALGRDDVLVASGTSCRQQIADFTGVRAWHAAELVQNLLATHS
jgi:Fe-S oxidoreductase